MIDTSPGLLRVGASTVKDKRNLGPIDVTTVLARSSNVGVVKIALSLKPEQMHAVFDHFGFGRVTGSGFPGESAGILPPPRHWRPINQATISYGYGLSVTPLQLAQAYAVLGSGGIQRPVSLRRLESAPEGERVLDEAVARELVHMMQAVVGEGGTARRAARPGLPRVRQDRHGLEGVGTGRLLDQQVHRRVRRRRAGEQPAPRGRRGDRRAVGRARTTPARSRRRCTPP